MIDELPDRFDVQLLTFQQLLDRPPPSWLVEGLVPRTGLSLLYGPSGAGKSFLALDWALSVAAGVPWHGRDVRRGPVVYIAGEGSAGLGVRCAAWASSHGLKDVERFRLVDQAIDLLDPDTVERTAAAMYELDQAPALIVVDTLARSIGGGSENDDQDIGRFIASIDELSGAYAALVVHHTRKEDDVERGHSRLAGATDMKALLKPAGGRRLELTCQKMKDGAEFDPLELQLDDAAGSCVLSLIITPPGGDVDHTAGQVLDVLGAAAEPLSTSKIRRRVRARHKTTGAALEQLAADGQIEQTPDGWQLVPDRAEPAGTTSTPNGSQPTLAAVPAPVPERPEPPGTTDPAATEGAVPDRGAPRRGAPRNHPRADHCTCRIPAASPRADGPDECKTCHRPLPAPA